jgi:predicted transcriptional regulator
MEDQSDLIEMTAGIVSAYVGNNVVATGGSARSDQAVHGPGDRRRARRRAGPAAEGARRSGQEVDHPDYLICLEDGRKFKSLKRHLRTKYDMTPEDYRAKWNLPKDYPMVAPNYAEARSNLAKQMGLPGRPEAGAQGQIAESEQRLGPRAIENFITPVIPKRMAGVVGD